MKKKAKVGKPEIKFGKYRTSSSLIKAIKQAPTNKQFFSPLAMKFFGDQYFAIEFLSRGYVFVVSYETYSHKEAYYSIDPSTLALDYLQRKPEKEVTC